MYKQYYYLLSILLIVVAYSCSDFTEEDLENDTVNLLGPADAAATETQTLTFWWDFVEGADAYRLQIADPDFENIVRLELDTLIESNQFEYTLYPSNFEWRVRAENSAYVSEYFSRRISILEPVDITKQKVVLITPGKDANLNQQQIEFKWDELSIAHEYQFELHQGDWSGEDVLDPNVLEETKLTLQLEEGKYAWGVLARDTVNKEETPFTYRNLVVDLTDPNIPTLAAPADNANVNGLAQTFTWNYTEDNELTDISFTLQIYSDKDMTSLVEEKGTTLKNYEYTFSQTGTYYWRVMASDEAGNESAYSSSYSFTIANE